MSTVEVECREATCPRCGALASEYFERYLRPGEIPFFHGGLAAHRGP